DAAAKQGKYVNCSNRPYAWALQLHRVLVLRICGRPSVTEYLLTIDTTTWQVIATENALPDHHYLASPTLISGNVPYFLMEIQYSANYANDRSTVRWLRPDTGDSEVIARGHSLTVTENQGLAAYVTTTVPDNVRTSHLMRFDLVTKKSTDGGEIGEIVTYSTKGDTAIYFSAARNGRLVAITAVKLTQTD